MGIWLSCKDSDIDFSSSYAFWDKIRHSIVKSFMSFINDWINNNSFNEGETIEWNYYEELKQLVIDFNNTKEPNIDNYINLFKKYVNALSCFGFVGVFTLVNKEDTDSYYSGGNAKDIYELLETIHRYIDAEIYDSIMKVKEVFEHSCSSGESVRVS